MTKNERMMYDKLIEYKVATMDELLTAFKGNDLSWHETLEFVVYEKTTYSSYEQWYNEVVLDDITIEADEE